MNLRTDGFDLECMEHHARFAGQCGDDVLKQMSDLAYAVRTRVRQCEKAFDREMNKRYKEMAEHG